MPKYSLTWIGEKDINRFFEGKVIHSKIFGYGIKMKYEKLNFLQKAIRFHALPSVTEEDRSLFSVQ